MFARNWIVGAMLGVVVLARSGAAAPTALVSSAQVAQTIVVKDVTVQDGSVSGVVVNKSSATVYGVEGLVRQVWLWNDERHPGTESPGRTLPFTLTSDVAPHANTPFTLEIPPLAKRSDGRFVTTIEVTGFKEVGP